MFVDQMQPAVAISRPYGFDSSFIVCLLLPVFGVVLPLPSFIACLSLLLFNVLLIFLVASGLPGDPKSK